MPLKILSSTVAVAGLLALAPTLGPASATPRATPVAAASLELVSSTHHHHRRHLVRAAPRDDETVPGRDYGPAPSYGGSANSQNGSPPDNEFDPTRPYGGQAAITAPPGTDAYEEQANERRYFCEASPSRC